MALRQAPNNKLVSSLSPWFVTRYGTNVIERLQSINFDETGETGWQLNADGTGYFYGVAGIEGGYLGNMEVVGQLIVTGDGGILVHHPMGPSVEINAEGIQLRDYTGFRFFWAGTRIDEDTGTPQSFANIGPQDGGIHVTYDQDSGEYVTRVPANLIVGDLSGISIYTQNIIRVGQGDQSITLSGQDEEYRAWAGSEASSDANFRVGADGSMYAHRADVRGTIYAEHLDMDTGRVHQDLIVGTDDNHAIYIIGGPPGRMFSANYSSGVSGWAIDGDDNAEFRNITIRGELRATVLRYNYEMGVGGNLTISNATSLAADVSTYHDTILVKDNVLEQGSLIRLQARGDLEYMSITSGATQTSLNGEVVWQYSVTRDVDGSGANEWKKDDVIIDEGTTGYGWLHAESGHAPKPYLDVLYRYGAGADDIRVEARLGNLSGLSDSELNPSGFGLYSTNAFLKGKIIATSGELRELDVRDTVTIRDGGAIKSGPVAYVEADAPSSYGHFLARGIYLGKDTVNDKYVAFIGNKQSDQYMQFDGQSLHVEGDIIARSGRLYNLSVRDVIEVASDDGYIAVGTTKQEIDGGTATSYIKISQGMIAGYGPDGDLEVMIPTSGPNAGRILSGDGSYVVGRYGPQPTELFLNMRFTDLQYARFVPNRTQWGGGGRFVPPYTINPSSVSIGDEGRVVIPDSSVSELNFSLGDWIVIQSRWKPSTKQFLIFQRGYVDETIRHHLGGSTTTIHSPHINVRVATDDDGKLSFSFSRSDTGDLVTWTSASSIINQLGKWHALSMIFKFGDPSQLAIYVWDEVSGSSQSISGTWTSGTGSEAPMHLSGVDSFVGSDYNPGEELTEKDDGSGAYWHHDRSYYWISTSGEAEIADLRIWRKPLSSNELMEYRGD